MLALVMVLSTDCARESVPGDRGLGSVERERDVHTVADGSTREKSNEGRVRRRALVGRADPNCLQENLGVDLMACMMPEVSLEDRSVVNLRFQIHNWYLPFLDRATGEKIGRFVLTGKGFALENNEPTVPAPTLRFAKGGSINVVLHNDVPYNSTNIHTHGLHVSSAEDDPSIRVESSTNYTYTYTMPLDHGGGTHWYHPHVHPLAEVYVGSGASGQLIVEDADDGTEVHQSILDAPEVQIVFNLLHLEYLASIARGGENVWGIATTKDPNFALNFTEMGYGQAQEDEALAALKEKIVTLNGFYQPVLKFEQGRWYRLRMLSSISIEDLRMRFLDMSEQESGVQGGTDCVFKLLQRDGVYVPSGVRDLDFESGAAIQLHPASRSDIMVRCDGPVGSKATLLDFFDGFSDLGVVTVSEEAERRVPDRLAILEVISATAALPVQNPREFRMTACLPFYLDNLLNREVKDFGGIPYEVYNSFQALDDSGTMRPWYRGEFRDQWRSGNNYTFNIDVSPFSVSESDDVWDGWKLANETTSELRNVTIMKLGEVQQWSLPSRSHPLHIHVNHFQLVTPPDNDDGGYNAVGDWLDVVRPSGTGEPVIFRFQTDTFLGTVPLHCHNNQHSDMGAIGQAFVIDNDELDAASPIRSLRRAWTDSCSEQVLISTPAPTSSPSISPTGAPTTSPTTSPSNSPTTSSPTTSPTLSPSESPTRSPTISDLIVSVVPGSQVIIRQDTVILEALFSSVSPWLPVEYCWRRLPTTGRLPTFESSIAAIVGDLDLGDCDDDDAAESALAAAYELGRRGPTLVLRPWVFSNGLHRFQLTARQGKNVYSAIGEVSVVFSQPDPGTLRIVPDSGTAGVTKFNISLEDPNGGNVGAFQYRFAIQQDTVDSTPVSFGDFSTRSSLNNVILPATDADDAVSYVSLVAFTKNSNGVVSRVSSRQIVRLVAPSTAASRVPVLVDVVSGEEAAFQQLLSYFSVLANNKNRDVGSNDAQAKAQRFEELGVLLERLFDNNETVATSGVAELTALVFRAAAQSLTSADNSQFALGMLEWLERLISVWKFWSEEEQQRIDPRTREFVLKPDVTNVLLEALDFLAELPAACDLTLSDGDANATSFRPGQGFEDEGQESGVAQPTFASLYRSIMELAVFRYAPGAADFEFRAGSLRAFTRLVRVDQASMAYRPAQGRAQIYFEDDFFGKEVRALYPEVLVSVATLPPAQQCVLLDLKKEEQEQEQEQVGATFPSSSRSADEDLLMVNLDRRRTLQSSGPNDEAAQVVLVSDVLNVDVIFYDPSPDDVNKTFMANLTFDVLYSTPENANTTEGFKCGVLDTKLNEWRTSDCTTLGSSENSVACECKGVPREGAAFAAYVLADSYFGPPPPASRTLEATLVIVAPVFVFWLIASMLGYGRDKTQAFFVQRAASLVLLANKILPFSKHFADELDAHPLGKSAGDHAATSRASKVAKREAFSQLAVLRGGTRAYPYAVACSRFTGRFLKAHSAIGLLFFDTCLPRLLRSIVMPISFLACFGIVDYADQQGLELYIAIGITAVSAGLIAVVLTLLLNLVASFGKREFHRVANMDRQAHAICKRAHIASARATHRRGAFGENLSALKSTGPVTVKGHSDSASSKSTAAGSADTLSRRAEAEARESMDKDIAALEISVEENDLGNAQLQVFLHSQRLLFLQRQHHRFQQPTIGQRVRYYCWFLPAGEEKAHLNRIYGGRVKASREYRMALLKLQRIYAAYNLQAPTFNAVYLMTSLLFVGALSLGVLGVIAGAERMYSVELGLLGWIARAATAYGVGLFGVEPCLLMIVLCFSKRPRPVPRLITAPRKRFYSWDSDVSTKSINPHGHRPFAPDSAVADPFGGMNQGFEMRPRDGRKRRNSTVSRVTAKTAKTAKSTFSNFFWSGGVQPTIPEDDIDLLDFEGDDDVEDDELPAPARPKENWRSNKGARKGRTRRKSKSGGFYARDSDDDEGDELDINKYR